jgi:transcriptional regulator
VYTPADFLVDDPAWQRDVMRDHPFAALITGLDGTMEASHIPLLLEPAHGPQGTLLGHVARANPIWQALDGANEALAIFWGPHAYISPDWYVSPRTVPTWNFVTVHAYGAPRLLEGAAARGVLEKLTATNEAGLAPKAPWTLDKLSERTISGLVEAIVAFEIPIRRLIGKAKLGQNRKPEDVAGAASGLRVRGGPDDLAIAALMEQPPTQAREG